MCRNRPGPRCSDHPRKKLQKNKNVFDKLSAELVSIQEELAGGVDKNREKVLSNKLSRLKDKLIDVEDDSVILQLEYDATPAGQKELAERITDEVDEDEKDILENNLKVAQQRRRWQRKKGKEFLNTEKKQGTEAAIAKAKAEKKEAAKKYKKMMKEREAFFKKVQEEKLKKMNTPAFHKFVKNAQKTLKIMGMVTAFYTLIMNDMDDYISKKSNMLVRKLAVGGSAAVAAKLASSVVK